jgi:poly(A) polymerase
LIFQDNTFGTPEEDAFRRDFTLNALFYDIETRAVIDYVGGLEDVRARLIRCIGQPDDRFREDPVRMLRAVALAARLDFRIDAPILDSVARFHGELARSAPARLVEEIYKVLRGGAAARTFRGLVETGLLAAIAPEVPGRISPSFWRSLSALDTYRQRARTLPAAGSNGAPAQGIPNAVLLGTLVIPLDLLEPQRARTKEIGARFGILPLARRDVEELRQLLVLERPLRDVNAPLRTKRSLMRRHAFQEALTWLEIHGAMPPETVDMWRSLQAEMTATPQGGLDEAPRRRRRRRRRRQHRAGPMEPRG